MRRLLLITTLLLAAAASASADVGHPDDPAWPSQNPVRAVRVPAVWQLTTGNPDVVIAVVDTGINDALIDLAGQTVSGWDFVEDDAVTQDLNGHGTLVATEIAARGDNAEAIAGYCWKCKLMPVRVSLNGKTVDDEIAVGVRWAADHGARIINVSFEVDDASPRLDSPLAQAVAYAQAKGALVVAAAGNSGGTAVTYPAGYPGVLSVAATDDDDVLFPWSTRGNWVQLAAPGCQIVQAPDTEWGRICGSSFTAPAVSAIAGLIFSLAPQLTATQVALALRSSAVPVAGIGGGRVDAYGALVALRLAPPTPTAAGAAANVAVERQARVIVGTVRRERTVSTTIEAGVLDLTLDMPQVKGCSISMTAREKTLVAFPKSRVEIRLTARVPRGRYKISIACESARPKPYTLAIAAPFAVRR